MGRAMALRVQGTARLSECLSRPLTVLDLVQVTGVHGVYLQAHWEISVKAIHPPSVWRVVKYQPVSSSGPLGCSPTTQAVWFDLGGERTRARGTQDTPAPGEQPAPRGTGTGLNKAEGSSLRLSVACFILLPQTAFSSVCGCCCCCS